MGSEIVDVTIVTEYITLGQLLKYKGIISMGNQAKTYLASNHVLVNGKLEQRRGRKLYLGDEISINNRTYCIKK